MYEKDLVFDVGMYNGDDTAYFLHRGYRVVAIEAHPDIAEGGRHRFADAIRDGRLKILNVAIGPEEGVAQMIIDERDSARNTLNPGLLQTPGWVGVPTHTLEVRSVRFKDVLAEHGVPIYLKIDIETYDRYCLEDLEPADLPPYVSFEASDLRDLVTMRDKGYIGFKIIRQQDHRQAFYQPNAAGRKPAGWPRLARALGLPGRSNGGAREPIPGQAPNHYQPAGDWQFYTGQTGPFGEDSEGPWRSFAETAMTWLAYDLGVVGPDFPGGKWHDIHCRAPIASTVPNGMHPINRSRIPA